jgi:hypothetical protein
VIVTIYSVQLGFLRRPYRGQLKSAAVAPPPSPSHLSQCLSACKAYFEYLLSIPETEYIYFTVAQWATLVQAVVVLSRLSFAMATALSWNSEATRRNIPLVMYLDALSYRCQLISTTPVPSSAMDTPKNPDTMYILKMMLGSVKKSYENRLADIKPSSFDSTMDEGKVMAGMQFGSCPVHDQSLKVYFDQRVDDSIHAGSSDYFFDVNDGIDLQPGLYGGNSGSIGIGQRRPVYFDLWATMMGNWASGT